MSIDPRFPDSFNFRDLGGLPAWKGRQVRPGIFYRSGALSRLNEQELQTLQSLGIRYVLDLRTSGETAAHPDPVLPGVTFLQHSGLVSQGGQEIDFSPAGMRKVGQEGRDLLAKLRSYYRQMPFDNEAFRLFFRQVRQDHVPILSHCATGKDRTGVLAILLELALGVPEDAVLADYARSQDFFAADLAQAFTRHQDEIAAHPELGQLYTMRLSVNPDTAVQVLQEIRSRCGSPEAFLAQEYGFTEESLTAFRQRFTR